MQQMVDPNQSPQQRFWLSCRGVERDRGQEWSVIADNDEQCFDIVVCEDEELNIGCYGKLRENITKAQKFGLVDEERSRLVSSFLT